MKDISHRDEDFGKKLLSLDSSLLKILNLNQLNYSTTFFAGSGTLAMDIVLNSLLPENKK
jgi:2-aminoethylphosphonate-pyruvate transaminase